MAESEKPTEVPWEDRYRKGPGQMSAFLPGGAQYTGALYGENEKAKGTVKGKRKRKPKGQKS